MATWDRPLLAEGGRWERKETCRDQRQLEENALITALMGTMAMAACAQEEPGPRLPVILSTDCGTEIDDQWQVIYLAISPEIDALGFIGNHARNQLTAAKARDTILDVLENRLGMANHPPVLAGSDGPIAAPDKPNDNEGVRFLIEQSKRFSPTDRLNVLIIGSHTDVASAILTDPTIVQRIRVIMMGMVGWPRGDDEWNVKNDADAARVVLESGVPLVVGCSEVCIRDLSFTTEECQALVGGLGPCGAWLAKSFVEFGGRIDLGLHHRRVPARLRARHRVPPAEARPGAPLRPREPAGSTDLGDARRYGALLGGLRGQAEGVDGNENGKTLSSEERRKTARVRVTH
jgi:inosine-uridine nucleoside N-ribohydrolase